MSAVTITSIKVKDNPCTFVDPFRFEITFESTQNLQDDLEWRLTYVGSADSEQHDQVLDSVLVGPVPCGVNRFEFEAPSPDVTKIPNSDLLGVTVVLLECLYRDKIFVRVGYYVNNDDPNAVVPSVLIGAGQASDEVLGEDEEEEEEEEDEEEEGEEEEAATAKRVKMAEPEVMPPAPVPVTIPPPKDIRRTLLEDAPRITRFPIDWDQV
ncbi:hypothetical protein BASA81_001943 [Batrachochytrium salamandrivorans]|nr:hypothetical protein BASA81_001943 [Batrachochytrium salamandrivorans]